MFCAPVFCLIHWFFYLSSFVIPSKCLKNRAQIHHHHHVAEVLGIFPVPWSSRWSWSLHLFFGRPMFLRPLGWYCSVCFDILFVSILCTCCSHFSWYLLYLCVLFPRSPFLDHVSGVRRGNRIKMHENKYLFPKKTPTFYRLVQRYEGSNTAPRAFIIIYTGADKSFVRPGRKKANVSVRIVWISFGALPSRKKNLMTARVSILFKSRASLTCFRACFLPGRARDLSAPRYLCVLFPRSPFLDHVSAVRRANRIKMHENKYFVHPKNHQHFTAWSKALRDRIQPHVLL